jgi:undecaprenyl-diphosphatase
LNTTTSVAAPRREFADPASSSRRFPILEPRRGGLAERFAGFFDGAHPAIVFVLALALGFAVVAGLSVALGSLVTDVLLRSGGLQSADQGFVETVVDGRGATLTTISEVGSTVGSIALVVLAILVAVYFAFRRQWVAAAYALLLSPVESGIYRLTSTADPRVRPDVVRLEDLPLNESYPSGHTAASVAVYAGLVLLLTSRIEDAAVKRVAWAAAALIAAFVAMSRIYRGMHHPLDAVGGALVGIGAILVLLFACRSAGAAIENRTL